MGLKFHVHVAGLDKLPEELKRAGTKAEHTIALQVRKDTSEFVPKFNGNLDANTRVEPGDNKIIYPAPMSRFLYYGKVMIDPETGSPFARKDASKVVVPDWDINFSTAEHPKAQAFWFEASKALNMDKWLRVADRALKHEFRKK